MTLNNSFSISVPKLCEEKQTNRQTNKQKKKMEKKSFFEFYTNPCNIMQKSVHGFTFFYRVISPVNFHSPLVLSKVWTFINYSLRRRLNQLFKY